MNPESTSVEPADVLPDTPEGDSFRLKPSVEPTSDERAMAALVEETAAQANDDVGHWLRTAFQARQEGLSKESRALLEAAVMRFPLEAHVRHDLGRLEEAERNWPAAERNWRAFSALSPAVWWGHTEIAHTLQQQGRLAEADAVLAEAWAQFPQEPGVAINLARMAELRGDWPEAVARWRVVAARFPEKSEGPVGEARGLRLLGQPDEARALLLQAASRFPTEAGPLHDLARLEEGERNWHAAEMKWREYLALDPTHWWAHVGLATVLHEQGRMAEAEAQFADAEERFPDEAEVFNAHARLAERRQDWPNASARWKLMAELFPAAWEGLAGQARAQRAQGRLDVARGFLVHAVDQFPAASGPLHDLARLEEAERNWPAAERCWRAYVALEPTHWWGHVGLANALLEQGRDGEAEMTLGARVEQLGHEPAVLIEHARMADRRGDWVEARARWAEVATRFPDLWDGFGGQVRSLRAEGCLDEAETVLTAAAGRFDGQDGPLLERAHLAEAQGDWAAAAAAWRALVGSGERVWWFYGRLLQAECRQRDLQAAFETFAAALARFPGDLTAVIDFVSILIDNDYREPAREYISEALRGAASTPELIELGQLALRGDETLLAKEAVERLQRGAPHGPQFAERIRELEATLADRAAVEARERADQASVAAVRPAEQPSGKATAQRPGGGDSWLRRAAGLLKGRPAAGEVRGRDGAMNG